MTINQAPPSPRSIDARIPKDLETICLKAMSKGREQRYGSCRELADDLRRWQQAEPIHARPLPSWEKAWLWCKRNPVVGSLSATVILVLLAGVIVSTLFAAEAIDREREAIAEKKRADEAAADLGTALEDVKGQKELADEQKELADEQRKVADEQRKRADEKAERERQARERADKAATDLRVALEDVIRQKERADQEKNRAERSLYAARIALAHQKWLAAEIKEAERLLSACPEPLRHWEWDYLNRLCHSELMTLEGHTEAINALAVSPDGKLFASGSEDESVKIWDAKSGRTLRTLRGVESTVHSVVFSGDGDRLAASGAYQRLKVWDTGRGQELLSLDLDYAGFSDVGPLWKRLASSRKGGVMILDMATGRELLPLRAKQEQNIESVAFSPDGKRLAPLCQ